MNLDYRSTQCPLGKIANFFPGTQNWAVFQWTTKLPGMLARVFVFLLPCKGNLMQGRVPWKRCIFPFSVDSLPHIEYCHNFSGTEHKLSSLFQLWYFKKNLNINFFPGILSFFTDTSFFFFFFLLEKENEEVTVNHQPYSETFFWPIMIIPIWDESSQAIELSNSSFPSVFAGSLIWAKRPAWYWAVIAA